MRTKGFIGLARGDLAAAAAAVTYGRGFAFARDTLNAAEAIPLAQ
jgi:hypothetical protein